MRISNLLLAALFITLMIGGLSFPAIAESITQVHAKKTGVPAEEASKQIQAVFSTIESELEAGRAVTITNFGRFYLSEREARVGRNPKTGAALNIPAKRYPRFTSSDNLKERLNPNQMVALGEEKK